MFEKLGKMTLYMLIIIVSLVTLFCVSWFLTEYGGKYETKAENAAHKKEQASYESIDSGKIKHINVDKYRSDITLDNGKQLVSYDDRRLYKGDTITYQKYNHYITKRKDDNILVYLSHQYDVINDGSRIKILNISH